MTGKSTRTLLTGGKSNIEEIENKSHNLRDKHQPNVTSLYVKVICIPSVQNFGRYQKNYLMIPYTPHAESCVNVANLLWAQYVQSHRKVPHKITKKVLKQVY